MEPWQFYKCLSDREISFYPRGVSHYRWGAANLLNRLPALELVGWRGSRHLYDWNTREHRATHVRRRAVVEWIALRAARLLSAG